MIARLALLVCLCAAVPAAAQERPVVLIPLYSLSGGLHAADVYTTWNARQAGAVEANPAMRGIVDHCAAFVAAKSVTAAGTILLSERLWRTRHRKAAILTMIVSNSVLGAVVAHNARVR